MSDDDIELKLHLFKVHSVKVHLKELAEMCVEVEKRELREGWNMNDILEEERDRREANARKRKKLRSGGWRTPQCLDNNAEAETNELDCYLCQEIVENCEYDTHLEKLHRVLFGLKEIKKAGEKDESVPPNEEPDHENEETELEVILTDADTVKELVEMKYLQKKRKIKIRTVTQRFFSRKYEVLTEEVFVDQVYHNICLLLFCLAGN